MFRTGKNQVSSRLNNPVAITMPTGGRVAAKTRKSLSLAGFWLFCCLPMLAQGTADTLLLTNIGIWDGSSGEVRNDQHILIIAGEIVAIGPEKPPAPSGAQVMDGTGHVALGTITPGQIANLVVFDANPQEDISILARADLHTQLLIKDGQVIENYYENFRLPEPDYDDPDHVQARSIEANNGWASFGFGGAAAIDAVELDLDDASQQQFGGAAENERAGVTAARLILSGHLGRSHPVNYYVDWGYNGFDEGFDINAEDDYTLYNLEFRFPETRLGKLTVGRMKAPTTISRVWSGIYLPVSARQAPVSALTRARDDGVRLTNTAFDKRMTWGIGVFNDWLTVGRDIGDTNTYVTGRVTGLVLDDQPEGHLLHVGIGFRWTDFVEETIRFRAKPGVPLVPDYLDTGDMPSDGARWLTTEVAWRKKNLMLTAEHIRTDLDSPSIGNPTFTGSYVWLEWMLTGETRSFNKEKATFGRPIPFHDFSRGGNGLWSLGLAFNDTDLNEGLIDGGDMQQVTIGINWYPQKSYRWGLEYGRMWLDRDGLDSTSEFLHLFFHVTNL